MSGSLPSIFESRARPSLHHHGRICRYIGGRAAGIHFRQPGALDVCRLPLPGHNHRELHQDSWGNLMLDQQEEDTGSAVALMSCFGVLMDSMGMAVISQNWGDKVAGAGGHEHPGGTGLPWIVGALGGEAFGKQIPDSHRSIKLRAG